MKRAQTVSHHAVKRAEQRWGTSITIEEIERQIESGEAEIYERQNPVIWKILVRDANRLIPIVYNRRLKVVITVLPVDELHRIQVEIGAGLPTKESRRAFWESLSPKRKRELEAWKREQELLAPDYNVSLVIRAKKRMEFMDSLPADVRAVVHEYNLEIVREFWAHKIRCGNDIAIMIEAARKAAHWSSPNLLPLYRHFGVSTERAALHLITAARMEPTPAAPAQPRYAFNRSPNKQRNPIERSASSS